MCYADQIRQRVSPLNHRRIHQSSRAVKPLTHRNSVQIKRCETGYVRGRHSRGKQPAEAGRGNPRQNPVERLQDNFFFLKHGHLQLEPCKSLAEQGIDSQTILTLRPKALHSPVEGGAQRARNQRQRKCELCQRKRSSARSFPVAAANLTQPPVASQPVAAISAVSSVSLLHLFYLI